MLKQARDKVAEVLAQWSGGRLDEQVLVQVVYHAHKQVLGLEYLRACLRDQVTLMCRLLRLCLDADLLERGAWNQLESSFEL